MMSLQWYFSLSVNEMLATKFLGKGRGYFIFS